MLVINLFCLDLSVDSNFKHRRNIHESNSARVATPYESDPKSADQKKLVHKKSLIETFQKLFKSAHRKNPNRTPQADNTAASKPIELLNYKRQYPASNELMVPAAQQPSKPANTTQCGPPRSIPAKTSANNVSVYFIYC